MPVTDISFGDAVLHSALVTVYGVPLSGVPVPDSKALYSGLGDLKFAQIKAWRFGTLHCSHLPSPIILVVSGKGHELTEEECGFKPGSVLKWTLPPDAITLALETTKGPLTDVLEFAAARAVDGGVSIENPHVEGTKLCATIHIWAKITVLGQTAKFDERVPACIDIGGACVPVWDIGWAKLEVCYKPPKQICGKLTVGKFGIQKSWEQCFNVPV
jgi:hypothetical protein